MKGFLEVISVDFLCQSWVDIHGNPGLLILSSICRLCTRINYMHFWVRHIYKSVACILPPSALQTFKQQLCRPQILYYILGATCPIPYVSHTCHRLQQRLYMNTRGQPELQIYYCFHLTEHVRLALSCMPHIHITHSFYITHCIALKMTCRCWNACCKKREMPGWFIQWKCCVNTPSHTGFFTLSFIFLSGHGFTVCSNHAYAICCNLFTAAKTFHWLSVTTIAMNTI